MYGTDSNETTSNVKIVIFMKNEKLDFGYTIIYYFRMIRETGEREQTGYNISTYKVV